MPSQHKLGIILEAKSFKCWSYQKLTKSYSRKRIFLNENQSYEKDSNGSCHRKLSSKNQIWYTFK